MPLLADYVITPDVFDVASYSTEEAFRASPELVREALREGLVRNLRKGDWKHLFLENKDRAWYSGTKEIIRKLRLIEFDPALPNPPTDDTGWCAEAIATHQTEPFKGGVIVTEAVKNAYPNESIVARIDRLRSTPWWALRSPSVSLQRTIKDYKDQLDLVLRYSNSLLFIDPHLDPTKRQYSEFYELLVQAGKRTPPPTIEIHRVCYEGSGKNRTILKLDELEGNFRYVLEKPLRDAGLTVSVFVWDEFHDRYLISNLIGILLPNGFDTSTKPDDRTRWTRLGRSDRDDIQREFDPSSKRHELHRQFTIP